MDLYRTFVDAPSAKTEGEYQATPLGPRRRDFLAKSATGSPIFLLHDSSPAAYRPAITLKTISIQFQTTCRIAVGQQAFEGQFAVVACDSSAPELFELFVCCISAAAERLPPDAGTGDLEECVNELLELFTALARPTTRQITGLWAELFVICRTGCIGAALDAWRADPFERFDFSCAGGFLEVKATIKEQRTHEFALEQLQSPTSGLGLVASLLLQQQNGGEGVMCLARRIEAAVMMDSVLRTKLWKNVAASLGSEFSDRLDKKFDTSYAERNIMFYAVNDIPSLKNPEDLRITNIRFQSDLAAVQSSIRNQKRGLRMLLD